MSSPPVKNLLQVFTKGLHSSVPLRHFSEHHDEASIRDVAQQEGEKALMHFIRKTKTPKLSMTERGDLIKEFCAALDKLTEEHLSKNQDSKEESQSFLQKRMEVVSEDFLTSFNAKLLMNPEMNLEAVEEFFKRGMLKASEYLEHFWKHGNVVGFEEQRAKLQKEVDQLKKEMLEMQCRHLETKSDEEARLSFKEVRQIILEMSRQVKFSITEARQEDTNHTLKESVRVMYNYLVGKGRAVVTDKYEKPCLELLTVLKEAMKFLDEVKEDMSVRDALKWAEKLSAEVESFFVEYEKHEQSNNGMTSNVSVSSEMNEDACLELESDFLPETTILSIKQNNGGSLGFDLASGSSQVPSMMKLRQDTPEEDVSHNHFVENEEDEVEPSELASKDSVFTEMNEDASMETVIVPEEDEMNVTTVEAAETSELETDKDNEPNFVNRNESDGGVKRAHPEDQENEVSIATKRLRRQFAPENEKSVSIINPFLNVPGNDGCLPLLRAICKGESVELIKRMLDNGADVNIKDKDNRGLNAAHAVIKSLINKQRNSEQALAILNLLVAKGFTLINDASQDGFTPLLAAIELKNLNEEILSWFFNNGADFNVVEERLGNSILLQAIGVRQCPVIIHKILDFGGDPIFVNKGKCNALHMSARYAHLESVLEIFLRKLDVNEANENGDTPLHLLFMEKHLEYGHCLEMLLGSGANFEAKCNKGYFPLQKWTFGVRNPYPTLMKMKDKLPITEEIASATLTTIVQGMEGKQEFLPLKSRTTPNQFVKFILYLIEEKKATLLWKDGSMWKQDELDKLIDKGIFSRNFIRELKTTAGLKCNGKFVRMTSKSLGELEFESNSKSGSFSVVPMETILACMLACKNYQGFVEVCRFVQECCAEPEDWMTW